MELRARRPFWKLIGRFPVSALPERSSFCRTGRFAMDPGMRPDKLIVVTEVEGL